MKCIHWFLLKIYIYIYIYIYINMYINKLPTHYGRFTSIFDFIEWHNRVFECVQNALRPRQIGCQFTDDISRCILLKWTCTKVSFSWSNCQYSSIGSDNGLAPTQATDKMLFEKMTVNLLINRVQYQFNNKNLSPSNIHIDCFLCSPLFRKWICFKFVFRS